MREKSFTDSQGHTLIVRTNRSNIQLLTDKPVEPTGPLFVFYLDSPGVLNYLRNQGYTIWKALTSKEADSLQSDYTEWYDPKTDNNGYLNLTIPALKIEPADYQPTKLLYKFNKRRIASFIYDTEKRFPELKRKD